MKRALVRLPDGRLAIPIEPQEALQLNLTDEDFMDIHARYGTFEAVKHNKFRDMPLADLFAHVDRMMER